MSKDDKPENLVYQYIGNGNFRGLPNPRADGKSPVFVLKELPVDKFEFREGNITTELSQRLSKTDSQTEGISGTLGSPTNKDKEG